MLISQPGLRDFQRRVIDKHTVAGADENHSAKGMLPIEVEIQFPHAGVDLILAGQRSVERGSRSVVDGKQARIVSKGRTVHAQHRYLRAQRGKTTSRSDRITGSN